MKKFAKGSLVHFRNNNGVIDKTKKYIIRSCGKKQATVDYYQESEGTSSPWNCTGTNYNIQDEAAANVRYQGNIPSYVKTSWDQMFALAGVDGWDPKEN